MQHRRAVQTGKVHVCMPSSNNNDAPSPLCGSKCSRYTTNECSTEIPCIGLVAVHVRSGRCVYVDGQMYVYTHCSKR